MDTGKYIVIQEIHVYDCNLGQLKIPKGKIVEVKEHGFRGSVDGNEFPEDCLIFAIRNFKECMVKILEM